MGSSSASSIVADSIVSAHCGHLSVLGSHGVLTPTQLGSMCRSNTPSGDTGGMKITLLEGSALLGGHDDLAPEPVTPPQDTHLLNGDPLSLGQEEDDIHGHDKHPEGEEDVGAELHTATGRTFCEQHDHNAGNHSRSVCSRSNQTKAP